ncbi:MAG: DUF1926 domain-containing protein [Treponema sp.]|nr:DUF1926 domain-containing protein [Treponema sp.]
MNSFTICIALSVDSAYCLQNHEDLYQSTLKKLVSFLYANPQCRIAMHFSGVLLDWLYKQHPEYIQILRELTVRKQIELLGGGYYDPVFPLLFSQDRSGQIELLTSCLTHAVGKRPRGMTLYGSVWDPSLIPGLQTCGMEYVLLNASLIAPGKRLFCPLLVSEQGKRLKVLPVFSELLPEAEMTQPENAAAYLSWLHDTSCAATGSRHDDENKLVTLQFGLSRFMQLVENGWITALYNACSLQAFDGYEVRLPLEYLHKCEDIEPAYISAGLESDIAKWGMVPYEATENKSGFPVTIQDFLSIYPRNKALYNRVLYIATLIAQTHGDKVRRQAAREKLWEAQNGASLICNPDGVFASNLLRQNAYRSLTEAEKLLRECAGLKTTDFKESVLSYDYDGDGYNEYLCRMQQFTACISRRSGSVTEFDVMHNTGNYADNLKRIAQFDSVSDGYERGLFVDHLFTQEEYEEYKKKQPSGNGVFSAVLYKEAGFESSRHEVKLRASAEFSSLRLPVSLRKNYTANSNGFTLQYILKNEGPLPLKGVFVVESNFAQTDFSDAELNSYRVAVISQGQSCDLGVENVPGSLASCSYMQITDTAHDISFVYEPNENADAVCMPLVFHRPKQGSAAPQIAGTTFVASFCWNVELQAGMEMEKTVSFTVLVPKKRRGSKKKQ